MRLYSLREYTPLMLSAAICLATVSSTWRLSQTKLLSSSCKRRSSSVNGISSNLAKALSLTGSRSRSSGLAQMLGTGTLDARIKPLRSRMRPRFAGSSRVRTKRTTPWRLKNALSMTCT